MTPVNALIVVLLLMLAEQRRSIANERALRRRGAVEPAGDVYGQMAWAYPAAFIAMAVEGWWRGGAGAALGGGLLIFAAAKALKYWAMASLGPRWTFRVLVPPGAPLVASGPYRWLRHPNYVGVMGEIAGFGTMVGAPAACIVSVALFGRLLWRRVKVEEKALRTS